MRAQQQALCTLSLQPLLTNILAARAGCCSKSDAAMRQMLRRSPSMVPFARAREPGTSLGGSEVRYTVACEQTCCMIATSGFPPHLNSALTGLSPRPAHHITLQTWVTSPLSSSQA